MHSCGDCCIFARPKVNGRKCGAIPEEQTLPVQGIAGVLRLYEANAIEKINR